MLDQHGRINSQTKRTATAGFVMAVTLLLGASGAIAAGPHHRVSALGGSCRGSASAIAQYCEEIPTPGGGRHPGPGTPTVSSTLPPAVVSRLDRSPRLRPLLRVPAASAAFPGANGLGLAGGAPGLSGQGADSSSIWAPMILTLALIALVLGAVEIVRRRRLVSRAG